MLCNCILKKFPIKVFSKDKKLQNLGSSLSLTKGGIKMIVVYHLSMRCYYIFLKAEVVVVSGEQANLGR